MLGKINKFHSKKNNNINFFLLLFLTWYFVLISLCEAMLGEAVNNSANAINIHETLKSSFDMSSSGDT